MKDRKVQLGTENDKDWFHEQSDPYKLEENVVVCIFETQWGHINFLSFRGSKIDKIVSICNFLYCTDLIFFWKKK